MTNHQVTTFLEHLNRSQNFTCQEMSGILVKSRKCLWKKSCCENCAEALILKTVSTGFMVLVSLT